MGPGPRVTDENAAVNFTDPASPLLNFPNKIEAHDFDGWVQERGLYFWEKWDPQYHTVLSMHDPGEKDVMGSLLWAHTGKGHLHLHGPLLLAPVARRQRRRLPPVREFAEPIPRQVEISAFCEIASKLARIMPSAETIPLPPSGFSRTVDPYAIFRDYHDGTRQARRQTMYSRDAYHRL
jgi:hypothetical protein